MVAVRTESRDFYGKYWDIKQLESNVSPELAQFPLTLLHVLPEEITTQLSDFNKDFAVQLHMLTTFSSLGQDAILEKAAAGELRQLFGEAKIDEALPVVEELEVKLRTSNDVAREIARQQQESWLTIQSMINAYIVHLAEQISATEAQIAKKKKIKTKLANVNSEGHVVVEKRKAKGESWLSANQDRLEAKVVRLRDVQTRLEKGVITLFSQGKVYRDVSGMEVAAPDLDPTKALPMVA